MFLVKTLCGLELRTLIPNILHLDFDLPSTMDVEFDVTDAEGRVIYPRGFQFNVLNHVFLPYRIVVIDPSDSSWAAEILRPTDMVILTGGDFREVSESLDRSTFILDDKTRRRLGVEAVPSIVTRVRNEFVIEEFLVEEDS